MISSSGMYGAEAVVLNLARNLVAEGHECLIGVFSNHQDTTPQLFEVAGASSLHAFLIPCDGQIDRRVSRKIRSLLSEEKIDVLHSHGYKADCYARFAAHGVNIPVISTCHTWHDTSFKDRLYGRLDRFALRGFDAIIAVSSEVERRLLDSGVSFRKVHRIRNGIDVASFQCLVAREDTGNPLVVGLACRLAYEKGIDIFAHMAADVLRQLPNVRFRIAGDGDQRGVLERLLGELSIASRVEVLGRVDDMSKFYASLDILVSSSRTEGFPMGLLEAMATGLPIVATAVGEVPQIVKDGETGLLVPAGDVGALVAATISLLTNAEIRRAYGSSARTVAFQDLSAARMTFEILDIYRQVLRSRLESGGGA